MRRRPVLAVIVLVAAGAGLARGLPPRVAVGTRGRTRVVYLVQGSLTSSRPRAPRGSHLDDWHFILIVLAGAGAGLIGLLWWRLARD